ncbi:MAG: OsmC family protein [Sphingobacteriales bacterium]|nr:OsmC family protein [Sphingobacteriales bacterium]
MSKNHEYSVAIKWTGNMGSGTSGYTDYERSHIIQAENKGEIMASSDPYFRGDKQKYNPEELFLASLSSCHMLWFLHLCAIADVVITDYKDQAKGVMDLDKSGSGKFTVVDLYPEVTVSEAQMIAKVEELHHQAHKFCFIANSVNFPVNHHPKTTLEIKK